MWKPVSPPLTPCLLKFRTLPGQNSLYRFLISGAIFLYQWVPNSNEGVWNLVSSCEGGAKAATAQLPWPKGLILNSPLAALASGGPAAPPKLRNVVKTKSHPTSGFVIASSSLWWLMRETIVIVYWIYTLPLLFLIICHHFNFYPVNYDSQKNKTRLMCLAPAAQTCQHYELHSYIRFFPSTYWESS